jgi:hypothetical protein
MALHYWPAGSENGGKNTVRRRPVHGVTLLLNRDQWTVSGPGFGCFRKARKGAVLNQNADTGGERRVSE